jgi:hypothetical protein
MALSYNANMVLIINYVPISFFKDCYVVTNIKENDHSTVDISDNQYSNKQFYKLGSSINAVVDATANTQIIRRNIIETTFDVEFWVTEETTGGKWLNNALLPALKVARRAIDTPCVLAYQGFYMAYGYLEEFSSTSSLEENRRIYSLHFVENIYRTFADETSIRNGVNVQGANPTDAISSGTNFGSVGQALSPMLPKPSIQIPAPAQSFLGG